MTVRHGGRGALRAGLALLTLLGSSCAGSTAVLHADALDGPVSLSGAYLDADGRVQVPTKEDHVGHFSLSLSHWSICWTLVALSDVRQDLSEVLNREMANAGGGAIVNLTVDATEDYTWLFTFFLPIIPHAVHIEVEGDVVRAPD